MLKVRHIFLLLLVSGVLRLDCLSSTAKAGEKSPEHDALTSGCESNMMAVWSLLRRWQGEGVQYPPDLSDVATPTNTELFICPSTGHKPGAPKEVTEWTDFFYVTQAEEDPRVAMLLSAPEDHGGRFGIVVWESGYVSRVTPKEFEALVREPWCMSLYTLSGQILENLKREVTVHVPQRLRRAYPNAYKAGKRALLSPNMRMTTMTAIRRT